MAKADGEAAKEVLSRLAAQLEGGSEATVNVRVAKMLHRPQVEDDVEHARMRRLEALLRKPRDADR